MTKTYYLLLVVAALCIASCGKDDPTTADPSFKFSIDWDNEFKQTAQDSFDNPFIPDEVDISWDEDFDFTTIDFENEDTPEGAFHSVLAEEDEPTWNVISATDIQGQDTVGIAFQIFAETLELKRYEFASAAILEQLLGALFGEEFDENLIPQGTVLPIMDMGGEFGEQIALFSFFAPSNYADSYLEITAIDSVNKTISGKFVLNWSYTGENPDTGAEEEVFILNISDGVFNKVPTVDFE